MTGMHEDKKLREENLLSRTLCFFKLFSVGLDFQNGLSELELLSRVLKSLIKVGYPSRFKSFLSDFLHVDSPCSCDHFEMRLTYVGLLVPKL